MTDDEITLTAEGATIMASEKVSTGDYENAQVSLSVDVSIEGVDVTDGISDDLRDRLFALQRQCQTQTKAAGEERRKNAKREDDTRSHEV